MDPGKVIKKQNDFMDLKIYITSACLFLVRDINNSAVNLSETTNHNKNGGFVDLG